LRLIAIILALKKSVVAHKKPALELIILNISVNLGSEKAGLLTKSRTFSW
jgi:hypothetical protein